MRAGRESIIKGIACASMIFVTARTTRVEADPLRLRSDALVQTRSPVGFLMLRGEDRARPWLDVETVAWIGSGSDGASGDVQTLTVRARDPKGLGEVRVGRFVFMTGAIRPVHIDGVRALGRAPFGTTLELFAGAPVAPRFGSRMFDFAGGGRLGQQLGTFANLGVSYRLFRKDGRLADQEVGPDLAIAPNKWLDVAARMAIDLVTRGPSDALVSIGAHNHEGRVEGFVTHRSPARILPSTSLFSVLGDIPSTTTGGTARYRVAPRLDLLGTGAAIFQGQDLGSMFTGRASLALDDDWAGTASVEVRRQYLGTARWSGARALLSIPILSSFRFATELEMVRPDDQQGRTRLWPWALFALGYRAPRGWDFAGGVEIVGTRDDRRELHALLRVSYAFERVR
jgi:hypothetical protein